MSIIGCRARLQSKYRRVSADYLFRRPFAITTDSALISFTFDDFPVTALSVGGALLRDNGLTGTYYVSLGLAGQGSASGPLFTVGDLGILREQGHELGCHTFSHCDSSATTSDAFLDSVIANQRALQTILPGASFRTFSFPKSAPRARTKRRVGKLFDCCRGGGQTFNSAHSDLNYLRAYFLEQAREDVDAIKRIIDQNQAAKGWLIFATHDVRKDPSSFGCTPGFFAAVVQYALASGAAILPVVQALAQLRDGKCSSGLGSGRATPPVSTPGRDHQNAYIELPDSTGITLRINQLQTRGGGLFSPLTTPDDRGSSS